jgi:DNA-binding MarR family transcriptional regulator
MNEAHSSNEDRLNEIATIAQALDEWETLLGRLFGPLSRPQRRMMRLLSREQAVRVGDLAEKLGLTTAGATRMLDKLEALHYAARARDQRNDQRQVYVTLTETGQQALLEANAAFLARVQTTLAVLNPTERATLTQLLYTMQQRTLAQAPATEDPPELD